MSSALTLLFASSLGLGGDNAPVPKKAPKVPKVYLSIVPGLFQISLEGQKGQFSLGEQIEVASRVTNISDAPQSVDVTSLSEGFFLQRIDPPTVCGVVGDHLPGYQARVVQVDKGAAVTSNYDLSFHPCFRGVGVYQATGSYCQYDPKVAIHGEGSPLWCLQSEPVTFVVVET